MYLMIVRPVLRMYVGMCMYANTCARMCVSMYLRECKIAHNEIRMQKLKEEKVDRRRHRCK